MRRLLVLGLALVALLGLVITGVATAASTSKIGEPGSVPDGEGVTVACNNPRESIVSGSAKINRKTSHGTTSKDVLTLDPVGAFWDTEVDMLKWGTFVNATGRKGWNSVTLTITCRHS